VAVLVVMMVGKKIKGRKRHILVDTMGLIHCLQRHRIG
jgi:hypothetical protein